MLEKINYGNIPMSFEVNQGQIDPEVKFISHCTGYELFLTSDGIVITLHSNEEVKEPDNKMIREKQGTDKNKKVHVIKMNLVSGNESPRIKGFDKLPGIVNYFKGKNPDKWYRNIPTYSKVKYTDVYPGIDMIYYGERKGLEYDFVVAPGASPENIVIEFEGVDQIITDEEGNLQLEIGSQQICLYRPKVYQEIDNIRTEISCEYKIKNQYQVEFDLGEYNVEMPLIIDPGLEYSTYLGGGGDDYGNSIAVDTKGNAYITGYTWSTSYPEPGFPDVFVMKLNAGGNNLLYSTYLSGDDDDEGYGIAVDTEGNAYITGHTKSDNFPITSGAPQSSKSERLDVFVTKLSSSGNTLLYSTYLGGNADDEGQSIDVDIEGNAYVTGYTYSNNFPTTPGAFKTTKGGAIDAFVTKINSLGNTLMYSTYLGGSNNDLGYGIAVDIEGNVYITGWTSSDNFPITLGAYQTFKVGGDDVFISKLNRLGNTLLYSTYLGGSDYDYGNSIAVDTEGNAYIIGMTNSNNFPTTLGAYQTFKASSYSNYDVFITKLNSTGDNLSYSTYLGGSLSNYGYGIAVDTVGNAYITGWTNSDDFPTTLDAYQSYKRGFTSTFITKLNLSGKRLLYSTYLGGSSYGGGNSIAVDNKGNAYITGYTHSDDFPTTLGAYQTTRTGGWDAFVSKFQVVTDLSVTKIDFPDPVVAGQELTYTLTVMNNGPDMATGVTLIDRLPIGVIFVSATTSHGSWSEKEGVLTCEIGTLENGESAIITVVVIPRQGGTITNTASVKGNEEDPNPDNNTVVEETWVLSPIPQIKTFAYVANSGSDNVSVIDIKNNIVEGNPIYVGEQPYDVAITPNGKFAYVVNYISNDVYRIDTGTNTVVGFPISVGKGPSGIAITPLGNFAYVTNLGSDNVYRIDTDTNAVVGNPISVGDGPAKIAITPDGKFAYVTNYYSHNVSVIDMNTNTVVGNPIAVGNGPYDIAITPDGKFAYVTSLGTDKVYVISTATNTVVGNPIVVGDGPFGIDITPDGKFAYVANYYSRNIYVIDILTNTVIGKPIYVNGPLDIEITRDGSLAYVVNYNTNDVSVIDTSTNTVIVRSIPVGVYPRAIAIANVLVLGTLTTDLSVTKTDLPDPIKVGNDLNYTITVNNNGPDKATGVMLEDILPPNVTFVSAESSKGKCSEEGGKVTCELGSLNNGENAVVKIQVVPTTEGTINNTVKVSANEFDPDISNNTAIQCTTVLKTMCMEVTKIFDSCSIEEEIEKVFRVPICEKKMECFVMDTECNVVKVSEGDEQGNIDVEIMVKIVVALKIKCSFNTKCLKKVFILKKTVSLYAPKESKITCNVKDATCKCEPMYRNKVCCTVDMTVVTKSTGLIQLEVPYLNSCNHKLGEN